MKYRLVITPTDIDIEVPEDFSNKTCWLCYFINKTTGNCEKQDRIPQSENDCTDFNFPLRHYVPIVTLSKNIHVL